MHLRDFNETFEHELRDPEYVEAYLQYALEEGSDAFFVALRDVAQANGGVAQLAGTPVPIGEAVQEAPFEHADPSLTTLLTILKSLGLRLTVERPAVAST